jgi:hypothetical protein
MCPSIIKANRTKFGSQLLGKMMITMTFFPKCSNKPNFYPLRPSPTCLSKLRYPARKS